MSKDKIEVSMSVYDIPIVIEALEKAENEIKKLNDIIDKAKNYIDKYLKEHIIEDQPDEQSIFYDEKGYYIPNAKEQLLNILNDKDN
jgi:hypothetical protein